MDLSPAEARMELGLLNSRVYELDRLDVLANLTNAGLPQEVVLRLDEIWGQSIVVAGQVTHIGKIVIAETMRFAQENPNLAMGVVLGAAVGALIGLVPGIGPMLQPLAITIGAVGGAVVGMRKDQGIKPKDNAIQMAEDIISLARKFFALLAAIFQALRADWQTKPLVAQ